MHGSSPRSRTTRASETRGPPRGEVAVMLHDRTAVVEAVCESLTRSDLYPALASRVTLLGMRFGAEGLLFRLNPFNTNVYADFLPDWLPVKPNAWLTIAEADILAYASTGRPIPSFDLELPSTRGGPPDARLVRLIQRCFSAPAEAS